MKTNNKSARIASLAVKEHIRRIVSPPSKENLREGSPKLPRSAHPSVSQEKIRSSPKNGEGERRLSAMRSTTELSQRDSALPRATALERSSAALTRSPLPTHRASAAPFCMNHAGKRALFKIEDEGLKRFLCGKCALIFNRQGLECEELSENEEDERSLRLRDCLELLKVEKRRAEAVHAELLARADRLLATDVTQVKHINKHFDLLIAHVQKRREAELRRAKDAREDLRQHVKASALALKKARNEFADFQADIEQNFESIVKKVEMDVFNVILGRYEAKVQGFHEFARGLAERCVEVPVPPRGGEPAAALDEACVLAHQSQPLLDAQFLQHAGLTERPSLRATAEPVEQRRSVPPTSEARSAQRERPIARFSPCVARGEADCFLDESRETPQAGWDERRTPELAEKASDSFGNERESTRCSKSLFPIGQA